MNCCCSRTAAVALDLARFAGPYECNDRRCWWNVKSTVPCMHQMRQRATEAYSTLQSTQGIRPYALCHVARTGALVHEPTGRVERGISTASGMIT